MANLRSARRYMTAIAIVLVVIDLAAAFILISPMGISSASTARQEEFRQVRAEVQSQTRKVVPPDQVQQRIAEARKQIAAFERERVPAEGSALSIELGKLASAAGVQLGSVHYNEQDSEIPGLRKFQLGVSIGGNYLQDVKFINSLERDKMLFVINSVALGAEQAGTVRLGLNLDTYLREQP